MKKSICVLLILTGLSAFALGPVQNNHSKLPAARATKEKPAAKATTPLTDLVIAPF